MNSGGGGGGGGSGSRRGGGDGGGSYRGSRGQPPQSVYRRVDRRGPVVGNPDDASPGIGTAARGHGGGGRTYGSTGRSRSSSGVAIPDGASPGSGFAGTGRRNSDMPWASGLTNKFNGMMSPDHSYGPSSATPSVGNVSEAEIQTPEPYQTPQESQTGENTSEGTSAKVDSEKSDSQKSGLYFDICGERDTKIPKLKLSLLSINREMKGREQGHVEILKPGMILLKSYISLKDQVKLIRTIRDLGRVPGGFYQPGYRNGAKLNLKMMCLGKNWDPETGNYEDRRLIDDTKAPSIPNEFQQLVKGALQKCHHHLESECKKKNAQDIIPSMSPDICIVNFYTSSGKLGLHQDKDESQESIRNGIPVVSFSLGDTAEFLYGEKRDIAEADKVLLKSGDVLVFGGKSRLIFHGVSAISSETAPKSLLQESNLKPGRLNLTFRQY